MHKDLVLSPAPHTPGVVAHTLILNWGEEAGGLQIQGHPQQREQGSLVYIKA